MCIFTVIVHIVPHATELGISAAIAASVLSVMGGVSIAGKIGLGSAGDRIGNKSAAIICFTLASAALFWLLVAKEIWMLYLFAAVYGFGYGASVSLQPTTVAELFGTRSHGAIMGMIIFIAALGGAAGPLFAGAMYDLNGNYYFAFLIYGIVTLIGLVLAILLRPPKTLVR